MPNLFSRTCDRRTLLFLSEAPFLLSSSFFSVNSKIPRPQFCLHKAQAKDSFLDCLPVYFYTIKKVVRCFMRFAVGFSLDFDYRMAKGVMIDGMRVQMRRQEGDEEKNRQENGEEEIKHRNGG